MYSVTTITDAVTFGRRGAQQCAIAWAHDQAVGIGRGSVRSPGEAESSAVEFTAGAHNQGGLRTRPITASELINRDEPPGEGGPVILKKVPQPSGQFELTTPP